jgi:transcriptional regulator with XRE-family HTH domain
MIKDFTDSVFPRDVGERLKQIRLDLGYSQKKFAHEIGVAQHNLSRYENGVVEIPSAILYPIFLLGYNLTWLLIGKGTMKLEGIESGKEIIEQLKNEVNQLHTKINDLETSNAQLKDDLILRLREIVELQNQLLRNGNEE